MLTDDKDVATRLQFARDIAIAASELILSHYQTVDLEVERKSDASPVTIADRGAEQLLRERIADAFPQDGIFGEEFGETVGSNDYRWVLDPIDGTKAFVAGVPLFGTLIGLERGGDCIMGVCRLPALKEVVFAQRSGGTWWERETANGGSGDLRRVTVSETASLAEASFCITDIECWAETGRLETLKTLSASTRITRGWGDCYGHVLVATGRADLMIDPLLNPWDAAALLPLVVEAGGHFVDFTGSETIHGRSGISVNRQLLPLVLAHICGEN